MNSYTWDRANRLLSMGGVDYQYDGEGRRVQQTVSSVVTKYLLDIQPGLAVVLSETKGSNVTRNVFSPRGIHAQKDSSNNWQWIVQDGLGNVREVVDNSVGVLESRNYDPYGNAFGAMGTSQTGFGFTGELVDGSGMLDLRARRYNAAMGVFASLDPFEGMPDRAMSLNGYSWVEGNVPNAVDPSGMIYETPNMFAGCSAGGFTINIPFPFLGVGGGGRFSALGGGTGFMQIPITLPDKPCELLDSIKNGIGIAGYADSFGAGDSQVATNFLISALEACKCELAERLNVWNQYSMSYPVLRNQLDALRYDIGAYILKNNVNNSLSPQFRRLFENTEYDVGGCRFYDAVSPTPSTPEPKNYLPCISLDPDLVQTTGTIYSAGAYAGFGFGVSLVEVEDIKTRRFMRLISFNPGVGAGITTTGGSGIPFVSEQKLEDFEGLSISAELDVLVVGVNASANPLSSSPCSGTTGGVGVASPGFGASLSISIAKIVYDSDWYK